MQYGTGKRDTRIILKGNVTYHFVTLEITLRVTIDKRNRYQNIFVSSLKDIHFFFYPFLTIFFEF